jgi:hypothetical protein
MSTQVRSIGLVGVVLRPFFGANVCLTIEFLFAWLSQVALKTYTVHSTELMVATVLIWCNYHPRLQHGVCTMSLAAQYVTLVTFFWTCWSIYLYSLPSPHTHTTLVLSSCPLSPLPSLSFGTLTTADRGTEETHKTRILKKITSSINWTMLHDSSELAFRSYPCFRHSGIEIFTKWSFLYYYLYL